MEARMKNAAFVLSDAMNGLQHIFKAINGAGLSQSLQELIGMRASQINGCSPCVHAHGQNLRKAGESDDRIATIAAWRDAPFFTDAERAVLALTEAATRLADRTGEAVSDEVWNDAADHFNEQELAAIILLIGVTNLFNRLNATIKEPAGGNWG
jgi:AhpD family alkylhydroperoxidase